MLDGTFDLASATAFGSDATPPTFISSDRGNAMPSTSLLVRHTARLLVLVAASAGYLGCAPSAAPPDQTTIVKGGRANVLYCQELAVTPEVTPIYVLPNTDFTVLYSVVNHYDDPCNHEEGEFGYVASGTTVTTTETTHPFPADIPAGDEDEESAGYHAGSSAGLTVVGLNIGQCACTGTASVNVVLKPAAPTGFTASAIDTTHATVGWTNGGLPTGTTTHVQYRVRGASWPSDTGMVVSAGVSSISLSGLSPATSYDVRAWHKTGTVGGDSLIADSLFTTSSRPSFTITSFGTNHCSNSGGANTYPTSWTISGSASGYTWEIRDTGGALDDPATGHADGTGRTGFSANVTMATGAFPNDRWIWIRYTSGTSSTGWVVVADNPLSVVTACPM